VVIDITGRRKKILTCKQNKNNKCQSLNDYAQQDLSTATRRPQNLDLQRLQQWRGLKPTSSNY
jgi:hypothetical protein